MTDATREDIRHVDLACRYLSPKEAAWLTRKLLALLKVPPATVVFRSMPEAGLYIPSKHQIHFDPETLSALTVAHEVAHAVEGKLPGPHHGVRHRLLLDAVAALTRLVG